MVLAAETDDTRQAITFLIVGLVVIALALTLLTIWYWRLTSPKRVVARALEADLGFEPPPPRSVVEASATVSASTAITRPGSTEASSPRVHRVDDGSRAQAVAATTAQIDRARVLADEVAEARRRPTPRRTPPAAAGAVSAPGSSAPAGSLGTSADADRLPTQVAASRDEVADARRRRDRREGVLSDDDWAAIQKSVFDQLDP